MALYLDSSAIVKLVVAEPESAALVRFLRAHPERVSSALSRVEVLRAVRLQGAPAANRARKVLGRIRMLRVDDDVLEAAATLDPRVLRSLDAIHVASARMLGGELSYVVTYDRHMSAAVDALGLPLSAPKPGRSRAPNQ
ncbi:MAG TPA: type II toxin-antitoxin system VapC family toxin [Polyangiaceae bacterium]